MQSNKLTARLVGALFLIATATYITGNGLIESILGDPEFLMNIYPNKTRVIIGVLLEFVDTAAVVGIGILMYPVLKKHNEVIAVGYVATRIIECVFLVIAGIAPLLLITLSQGYTQTGASASLHFETLGALFTTQHFLGYQIGMMALGLGSLMFCYLLYSSKLIPRWMSVLGFIGYAALFVGAVLELFGMQVGILLSIPGGIFELILPIWLIARDFNVTTPASESIESQPYEIKAHVQQAT